MSNQSSPPGIESHRIHSPLKATGIVVAAALAMAALGPPSTAEQRIPIEHPRQTAVARGDVVHPGLEWPAQIELIADALIVSPKGRESVEYHAELTIERGNHVGIAWDAEVLDDGGTVLHSGLVKAQETGAKGTVHVTQPIHVELADGFYALRARAAIAPEEEPATIMERIQYVEVAQGKWIELTDYEWYERSRAGMSFPDEDASETEGEVKP